MKKEQQDIIDNTKSIFNKLKSKVTTFYDSITPPEDTKSASNNQYATTKDIPKSPKYDLERHNHILSQYQQTSESDFDTEKGKKLLEYALDRANFSCYNPIGTRIGNIRKYQKDEHGNTKVVIADSCGISTSELTKYENNTLYPTDDFIVDFYDLFDNANDNIPPITLSFIATGYTEDLFQHLLFCHLFGEKEYLSLLKSTVNDAFKYFFNDITEEQQNICLLVNEMFSLNLIAKGYETSKTTIPYIKILSENAIILFSEIAQDFEIDIDEYEYYTTLGRNIFDDFDEEDLEDVSYTCSKKDKYIKELLNANIIVIAENQDYNYMLSSQHTKPSLIEALESVGITDIKKSNSKDKIIEDALATNKQAVLKLTKDYCQVVLVR